MNQGGGHLPTASNNNRRLDDTPTEDPALALAFSLAGCAAAAVPNAYGPAGTPPAPTVNSASGSPAASSSWFATPSLSGPSAEAEIVCQPNTMNALRRGPHPGRHTSQIFQPAISFEVPDGWSNHEDEARGYVLYAPGSRPPESEFGARDKIAILPDVASSPKGCEAPGPDVGESAQDIVRWMARRENLDVTAPAPVTVGGLDGFMVDVHLEPTAAPECFLDSGRDPLPRSRAERRGRGAGSSQGRRCSSTSSTTVTRSWRSKSRTCRAGIRSKTSRRWQHPCSSGGEETIDK